MKYWGALLVTFVLLPGLAWAYYPHPGDRAAQISGRDMLSGRQVDLEGLRGKWVLVEFTQPG